MFLNLTEVTIGNGGGREGVVHAGADRSRYGQTVPPARYGRQCVQGWKQGSAVKPGVQLQIQ